MTTRAGKLSNNSTYAKCSTFNPENIDKRTETCSKRTRIHTTSQGGQPIIIDNEPPK
ncbi:hypothetical protein NSE_0013 [Neorickettsia sennetsu str. Miyayama]|uniref:Uncharacterized protein n=1 Tax=Ehrlichia sennetsu (strain ATCC VR-367 / Miyayama) TaxID=222891 RepID=Q2GF40_EHRS3|nr:hypothetical protein NSE_0013 [Neorickettsia sennetsu str. Miyayama]